MAPPRKPRKHNKKQAVKAARTVAKKTAKKETKKEERKLHHKQKNRKKNRKHKNKKMHKSDIDYHGRMKILGKKLAAAYETYDKVETEEIAEEVIPIFGNGGNGVKNHHFYINPGNIKLFPVFSRIAQCYTKFEMKNFVSTFVTTSGQFVSTTQSGNVLTVIDYDSQNDPFPDSEDGYKQAVALNPRTETIPFESASFVAREKKGVAGSGFERKAYTIYSSNNSAVPTGTTASVFDYNPGILQVLVRNAPVDTQIGKLLISAKFKVWKYRLPHPGNFSPVVHAKGVPTSGANGIFSGFEVQEGSAEAALNVTATNNTLTIKPQFRNSVIKMEFTLKNTGAFSGSTGWTVGQGAITQNLLCGDTVSSITGLDTGIIQIQSFYKLTLGDSIDSATFTWPTTTFTPSSPTMDLYITVMPVNLITELEWSNTQNDVKALQQNMDARVRKMEDLIKKLTIITETDSEEEEKHEKPLSVKQK